MCVSWLFIRVDDRPNRESLYGVSEIKIGLWGASGDPVLILINILDIWGEKTNKLCVCQAKLTCKKESKETQTFVDEKKRYSRLEKQLLLRHCGWKKSLQAHNQALLSKKKVTWAISRPRPTRKLIIEWMVAKQLAPMVWKLYLERNKIVDSRVSRKSTPFLQINRSHCSSWPLTAKTNGSSINFPFSLSPKWLSTPSVTLPSPLRHRSMTTRGVRPFLNLI